MELPNIAAYAYQDVHVWSALLTCLRPPFASAPSPRPLPPPPSSQCLFVPTARRAPCYECMDPHLVGRIDGEGDGFLQYYTKITILGVGAGGHGYLCSGGMGSSPHAVELEAVVDDTLPANFERCVWSVLPVDIWNTSALSPPERGPRKGSGPARRPSGPAPDSKKFVKYGDVVQLQHAKTGSCIIVRTHLPSEIAPDCFMVDFVSESQLNIVDRRCGLGCRGTWVRHWCARGGGGRGWLGLGRGWLCPTSDA